MQITIDEQILRDILNCDTNLTEDVIDAVLGTLRNHPRVVYTPKGEVDE